MLNNFKLKNLNSEKGVSLIITFFIMIIILAVVLSTSTLLYSEIKVIRNISYSVSAFYSADSGIEKVLFYDRQILPSLGDGAVGERGLCYMCDTGNPYRCPNGSGDNSLFCNDCTQTPLDTEMAGCNANTCDNCEISFNTSFGGKYYEVIAKVSPSSDEKFSVLEVKSKGTYKNVYRQIDINSRKKGPQDIIIIENACVDPISSSEEETITIYADITSQLIDVVISEVYAVIKNETGGIVQEELQLSVSQDQISWQVSWSGSPGVYYVDLVVEDSAENIKIETNIPACNQ
jgi:hypothetical protein